MQNSKETYYSIIIMTNGHCVLFICYIALTWQGINKNCSNTARLQEKTSVTGYSFPYIFTFTFIFGRILLRLFLFFEVEVKDIVWRTPEVLSLRVYSNSHSSWWLDLTVLKHYTSSISSQMCHIIKDEVWNHLLGTTTDASECDYREKPLLVGRRGAVEFHTNI